MSWGSPRKRGKPGTHLREKKESGAFESFESLCDAVDVIDLCSPPSTHESLAVQALELGKHVIIEKPFTGFYGAGLADFRGDTFSKEHMLREAMASCARILAAAKTSGKKVCYAENWVYAPSVQKEREILVKSGGQILWIIGRNPTVDRIRPITEVGDFPAAAPWSVRDAIL